MFDLIQINLKYQANRNLTHLRGSRGRGSGRRRRVGSGGARHATRHNEEVEGRHGSESKNVEDCVNGVAQEN